MKEKYLPQITLKRSQSSPQIPENLSQLAIYGGLMRRLSKYRMLLYISIYFLGIFFLFFIKKMFLFSFLFLISIEFPQQNINQSERRIRDKKLSVELYARVKQSMW